MSDKIIRVAQILGIAAEGGVESMIKNFYLNIDKTKVQFDFFIESTSKIINEDEITRLGGRIIRIPKYTKLFKYIKFLKHAFKEGEYDIVHSNMNALSVFSLYAAKKAGIKIRVSHSHSTSNSKEIFRNFLKNILRFFSKKYATHYVACSEKAGRWLFGDRTFDNGDVLVVNNAVDFTRFQFNQKIRDLTRQELGLTNKFVIGHIGRFMKQKNHNYLIEIFSKVLTFNNDAVLVLVGEGRLKSDMEKKCYDLNLSSNVMFLGSQACPEKFYQVMDCFVMPSLYEGLPVVGVEAQISGLQCLFSTNITSELKILDNAHFLDLENQLEWVNKIKDIMSLDETREIERKFFIDKGFDLKTESEKLLMLYTNALNKEG